MTSRADMLRREISFSETIESVKLGLRYFLGVTSARDRAYVAFAYLTGAVLPATLALLNRYVIDIASRLSTPADDTLLFKAIWIVLGYFLGLTFLDFFQLHSNPFFRRAFLAATDKVGEDIVRKCCTIRLERFQDTRFYEHVEFLSGRVGDEMMQMMWHIMNVVMGVLSSVGVLALIAGTAPVICLVMVAGVIPCLLLYRKQSNIQYEQAYWELPSYRLVSNAIGMFIRKYIRQRDEVQWAGQHHLQQVERCNEGSAAGKTDTQFLPVILQHACPAIHEPIRDHLTRNRRMEHLYGRRISRSDYDDG